MKTKTYQIAKDKLKEFVDVTCSETCVTNKNTLFSNTNFGGGEHDGLDYMVFCAEDIHHIHKPVYISTDKIGEWLAEWGYAYKDVGCYFLIQFKGEIR